MRTNEPRPRRIGRRRNDARMAERLELEGRLALIAPALVDLRHLLKSTTPHAGKAEQLLEAAIAQLIDSAKPIDKPPPGRTDVSADGPADVAAGDGRPRHELSELQQAVHELGAATTVLKAARLYREKLTGVEEDALAMQRRAILRLVLEMGRRDDVPGYMRELADAAQRAGVSSKSMASVVKKAIEAKPAASSETVKENNKRQMLRPALGWDVVLTNNPYMVGTQRRASKGLDQNTIKAGLPPFLGLDAFELGSGDRMRSNASTREQLAFIKKTLRGWLDTNGDDKILHNNRAQAWSHLIALSERIDLSTLKIRPLEVASPFSDNEIIVLRQREVEDEII